MKISIDDQLFEWDDDKAKINKRKHGISFKTAAQVFFDENRIERYDEEHSLVEDRWKIIGKVREVLFVIYTERGEATRLISARKATPYERSIYYDNQRMD
ncbi:MAG: BrnT family toxin [Selenomonadaceae bacterium]|nr:BrnT family toxin [Selenomonadaceae bacterium]